MTRRSRGVDSKKGIYSLIKNFKIISGTVQKLQQYKYAGQVIYPPPFLPLPVYVVQIPLPATELMSCIINVILMICYYCIVCIIMCRPVGSMLTIVMRQ